MKKGFQILLVLLTTILSNNSVFAQINTDEELANQYFQNKEYDKAIVYFEKLLNKIQNKSYYLKLLDSYIALEEYKNAEKLIKNQSKRQPLELSFNVDMAYLYNITGKSNEAKQLSEKTIKQLSPNQLQVINLAQAFQFRKENEYAIQTYLQGRKLLKDLYPFNFELAQLYGSIDKTEEMFAEYLNLLVVQEAYIQSIQNALQTNLTRDDDNSKKEMLKSQLILFSQKHPDRRVFYEMLIWTYLQEENFASALIHAKALDKRFKEYGDRIMNLGNLCIENKDYETAIKCFQYVISKGNESFYYINAKIELVNVLQQKIVANGSYTNADLLELEQNYNSTIAELGKSSATSSLLRNYATFLTFYLHQPTKSIQLLTEVLEIPGINPHEIAQTKIELADVYLFVGEVWDASLLYSQVEKAFKYDQIGETAKFKNAKVSFYTGDFEWSKAQLQVLKASTSKLIANDAMELSLFITDNIGADSNLTPLLIFAEADLLGFQNKYENAFKLLDSLKSTYSYHEIIDDVLYKEFQLLQRQQKTDEALSKLEMIISNYPKGLIGDDAIYNSAVIYDKVKKNTEKAAELYKKILFDYKDSVFGIDARKRYREIKGNNNSFNLEN